MIQRAEEPGSRVPLSLVLERIGSELTLLTAIVADMQAGLSPLLIDASTRHPDTYHYAQAIDRVWQTLEGLAQVMQLAARDDAGRHVVDVAALVARLPLADVAKRLQGLDPEAQEDDLDLF